MAARIYLAIVGLLYAALGLWCAIDPQTTSRKVGFDLRGGSGGSEFLTVYGGLEVGLGLLFWIPLLRRDATTPILWGCLLIHTCLVVFRTIGFFRYTELEGMTWRLAVGEWIILLVGLAVWWWSEEPAGA